MTLRASAALALILGIALMLIYLYELGKGPWAGKAACHMRAMKDRVTAPASFQPFTIAGMAVLPKLTPLPVRAAIESRGVSVEGYVQRVIKAPDADYHLDFSADPLSATDRLHPYVVAEIASRWQAGSRTWRYERLLETFRPLRGGPAGWPQGPRRVRLSGWLMYDYPHQHRPPRPGRASAQGAWEIHPVTRIETWDDSLSRFVEYPR